MPSCSKYLGKLSTKIEFNSAPWGADGDQEMSAGGSGSKNVRNLADQTPPMCQICDWSQSEHPNVGMSKGERCPQS